MPRLIAAVALAAAVVALLQMVPASAGIAPLCDPFEESKYYQTRTYTPLDDPCRTYVLFDIRAYCLPFYSQASTLCENAGMELAPWNEVASKGAISTLCTRVGFTCWTSGPRDPGLCPLVDAYGRVQMQGCEQPVRFVCRTKGSNCNTPSPAPSPAPIALTDNVMTLTENGWSYQMFTADAANLKTWADANAYCQALPQGPWALVPYTNTDGVAAVKRLCANNSFTCWFGGKDTYTQCPMMSAGGDMLKQGCDQAMRFVCRKQV